MKSYMVQKAEMSFAEKAKMRYLFVPNCTWGKGGGGGSNKM